MSGIAKVSYTHDALVDQILANPSISQNALAVHFGYTPAWISQILTSDAFQARLAARRSELVDPQVIASVESNFKALVLRSQEILLERLNRPNVETGVALRALEVASRAAGYGARVEQTNVQVNIGAHLEELGNNLTQLLKRKRLEVGEPPIEVDQ